jgi:hypothetical protein
MDRDRGTDWLRPLFRLRAPFPAHSTYPIMLNGDSLIVGAEWYCHRDEIGNEIRNKRKMTKQKVFYVCDDECWVPSSDNLSYDRALSIGAGGLRQRASAFTGFSSFLLSHGSMAAPTAK